MYKIPDIQKSIPPPSGAVASRLDEAEAEAAQSRFMTSPCLDSGAEIMARPSHFRKALKRLSRREQPREELEACKATSSKHCPGSAGRC
jgi:hypothetical protein